MAPPAWKVMLVLAGGLVLFASYAAVFGVDVDLGSMDTVVALVLSLLFGGLFYYFVRFGYRLGKQRRPDE